MYSATISSAVRERTAPDAPEAQNTHPIAQPTCVEMHWVKRPVAGMSTVSTRLPSARERRSFFVPSDDSETSATLAGTIGNSDFRFSLKSFGSVVAASQSSI